MPIKALFSLLFAASATAVLGQNIELENLTVSDKGSKTVYIGLDNIFAIKDHVKVKGIKPQEGVVMENGVLRIRANIAGQLPVSFLTKRGREVVTFEAETVSSPVVAIGGWTDEGVDREQLLQPNSLRLTSFRKGDIFFEGYQITFFQVECNGHTFSVEGNTFPSELLQCIQKAKKGDYLMITNVKAFNKSIAKEINIDSHTRFIIQ